MRVGRKILYYCRCQFPDHWPQTDRRKHRQDQSRFEVQMVLRGICSVHQLCPSNVQHDGGSPTQRDRRGSIRDGDHWFATLFPARARRRVSMAIPRRRALDPWAWTAKENAKPALILRADGQQSVSRGRAPRPRFFASTGAPLRHDLPLTFLQNRPLPHQGPARASGSDTPGLRGTPRPGGAGDAGSAGRGCREVRSELAGRARSLHPHRCWPIWQAGSHRALGGVSPAADTSDTVSGAARAAR
jgi:hypothetical protein